MILTGLIAAIIIIGTIAVMLHPAFGALPEGTRMERMRRSPNYSDGQFHNLEETPVMTSDEGFFSTMWKSIFSNPDDVKPAQPVEAVKTNLHSLDPDIDQMVWFGHSSYLLVVGGKRILVDPVFTTSFPGWFTMHPFKGSDIYTPDDMPAIDLLIITHDHYDHLDYPTVRDLRQRVRRVVCPLGVGAHLERWGYPAERIVELDWNERRTFQGIDVCCLPARHFSGRSLWRNNTLWASFMLKSRGLTIYIGGDSGYGSHYKTIAKRFPEIDIALLEAGQYDAAWKHIHTMPTETDSIVATLHPAAVIPVHNSKYALAHHPWREPIETWRHTAERDSSFTLITPVIGQPIRLR